MTRRYHVLLALVIVILGTLLAAHRSAAAAEHPPSWGLRPAEDGIGWYDLQLAAGETFEGALEAVNGSDAPIELVVEVVDSVNISRGGFGLANGPGRLTQWIDFPRQLLTLEAHSTQVLPFTLTAPADPGEYGLGFVGFEPFDPSPKDEGIHIVVVSRIGVSLVVRVGDPSRCSIQFQGAEVNAARDGGALIVLDLTNTGNIAFEGSGLINVQSTTRPDSVWSESLMVGHSLPGPIVYPLFMPIDPGNYAFGAEIRSLSDPSCGGSLSGSFSLEPPPEPERSVLGQFVKDTAAYASELGGSSSGDTNFGIRVLAALSLLGVGIAFATSWAIWLWRKIKKKGGETND